MPWPRIAVVAVGLCLVWLFWTLAYNTGYGAGHADGIGELACLEQIDQNWKNGEYGHITYGEVQDKYWPQCFKK